MIENDNTPAKQPYEKPLLRVIELSSEEVLATGCKNPSTPNPGSPTSCIARQCAKNGS
jgi:hypothetical protein